MHETIMMKPWASTIAGNVACMDTDLKDFRKAAKIQYRLQGKLTAERIRARGEYPFLKGKAAQMRCLAPYALDLRRRFPTGKAVHDELRMAVCQLLARFFEIIAAEPIFMSDAAKTELAYIGPMFRRIYFQFAEEALVAK